jgi:hypothetical protein
MALGVSFFLVSEALRKHRDSDFAAWPFEPLTDQFADTNRHGS